MCIFTSCDMEVHCLSLSSPTASDWKLPHIQTRCEGKFWLGGGGDRSLTCSPSLELGPKYYLLNNVAPPERLCQ